MAEPLLITMLTTSGDAGKSTIGINGHFVFSQLLNDCLLRLKFKEIDRIELISCWKKDYKDNHAELYKLREFEEEYTSNKALWWYTRDSFFYKTLNTALRKEDTHRLFLYRQYIIDIQEQLRQNQSRDLVQVYRSQLMSTQEINSLKQNIGNFISVNSLLSTSKLYGIADFYFGDKTQRIEFERVLFKIDADPKVVSTKPFADISTFSDFPEELEVLFMLGSIFRLNGVKCDDNQVWIIEMSLCGDDEHDLIEVLVDMKKQNGTGETTLWTLGKLMKTMGKYDLAEQYYIRLIQELSSNDPSLRSLYADLSVIASQKGDLNKSVEWYQKSLAIQKQSAHLDHAKKG